MNLKKKVIWAFAMVIILVAISSITIPALAKSVNAGQKTCTQAGAYDQEQSRSHTRLSDGSCGNDPNSDTVDGSQQNRFGYGAANGCGSSAAQHRYQHGNTSPPS